MIRFLIPLIFIFFSIFGSVEHVALIIFTYLFHCFSRLHLRFS
jgi:hypothetical protein